MGFSIAISGGIIMLALISAMMSIPPLIGTTGTLKEAYSTRSDLENTIIKTDIAIESLAANSGDNAADFTLSNPGSVALWNYDKFNIIITYDGNDTGSKKRVTEHLSYTDGSPSSGEWGITQFVDDYLDPKILNSNESFDIESKLQYPIYSNGLLIVVVSTDNGVVETRSMVVT